MKTIEEWKDVENYKWFYQVSNLWRLKSLSRDRDYRIKWITFTSKEKIISTSKPYANVYLYKDKIKTRFTIHRLVAQAFLWLDINNSKMCVCHKDDNPLNNIVDNLFLWTNLDNAMDRDRKWRHWHLWKLWKLNSKSKKVWQYCLDWMLIKKWDSLMDIYRSSWKSKGNIWQVCNWNRNTAYGYKWKYL